jgi:hypothetical protein
MTTNPFIVKVYLQKVTAGRPLRSLRVRQAEPNTGKLTGVGFEFRDDGSELFDKIAALAAPEVEEIAS